jgi:hypothetical protein
MAEEGDEAVGAQKRKRGSPHAAEDVEVEEEEVYLQGGGGAEVKGIDEQEGGGGHEKQQQGLLLKDADDDAGVTEVMRWLEAEITDDVSAGFVTINGNEESCGPSFSSAASTVMAAAARPVAVP